MDTKYTQKQHKGKTTKHREKKKMKDFLLISLGISNFVLFGNNTTKIREPNFGPSATHFSIKWNPFLVWTSFGQVLAYKASDSVRIS